VKEAIVLYCFLMRKWNLRNGLSPAWLAALQGVSAWPEELAVTKDEALQVAGWINSELAAEGAGGGRGVSGGVGA